VAAWVVLFRGVGGATQLPVARLREVLTEAGFGRVATYLGSGNAVLTSDRPREAVATTIAQACAVGMGFAKDIHVLSRDEWAALAAANPFPEAEAHPTTLHAAVLGAEPDGERVAALAAVAAAERPNALVVRGRVAYILTPNGFSRSKLAERFDRGIGVPNTARNWRTVTALLRMAEAADA
jgi:uncharacterized protein (DUF1697 family)